MIRTFETKGAGGSLILDAVKVGHLRQDYAPGMRMVVATRGDDAGEFTVADATYERVGGGWAVKGLHSKAASGRTYGEGAAIWLAPRHRPAWVNDQVFRALQVHAQAALGEVRTNPGRARKIWMLQAVRVPRTHRDVVAHGKVGAAEVAARRRAFVLTPKGDSRYKNFVVFEQFDPKFATREYRTVTRNGVQNVSAVLDAKVVRAALKLVGTSEREGTNRGKPVLAVYRGPRGVYAVAFVTRAQKIHLPDATTFASLAAQYGGARKAGTTVSGVRLVRVVPKVERAKRGKTARKNPTSSRPRARAAACKCTVADLAGLDGL